MIMAVPRSANEGWIVDWANKARPDAAKCDDVRLSKLNRPMHCLEHVARLRT